MERWTIASHRKFADFRELGLGDDVVQVRAQFIVISAQPCPSNAVEGENPEPI